MGKYDWIRSRVFSVVELAYWGLQSDSGEFPLGLHSDKKPDVDGYPVAFVISKEDGPTRIQSVPQIPFKGGRLVIPSTATAPYFEIGDVWVGHRRQRAFGRWRPATDFTEVSEPVVLDMDRASIGEPISMEVRNITDTPKPFLAALIGRAAVRPSPPTESWEKTPKRFDRSVPVMRSVVRALFGGTDPDRVLLNRLHLAAFTVVDRAYWGLHEKGELCTLEISRAAVKSTEGAVDVTVSSDHAFQVENFIVSTEIAPHFSLLDIKVGNRAQLADKSGLPMQVFASPPGSKHRVDVVLDRAHPKQDISLVIENHSAEPQDFSARLVGRRLKMPRRGGRSSVQDAAAE
jgi:hypothetical protein